ncbi:MAG: lactate racemase domain-containing protein [Planctomycetaceae bacterium]|nr:lactate racemase domain-containing protein [Planctomycetaceae bacterium]
MKQLIAEAFKHPVNFPHISQVVYPGDQVVIAADAFVVRRPELLAAIVTEVISAGLDAKDVSVLMLEQERKMYEQPFRDALPEEHRASIHVVVHNPLDPQCLAMLAVAKDDSPVLLNRALVDADVVIPVEHHEAAPGLGYFGMHSVIYPRFADVETQKRYLFSESKKNREKLLAELVAEVGEMAGFLGVIMTVQILADLQNEVQQVIVGDAKGMTAYLAKKRQTAER